MKYALYEDQTVRTSREGSTRRPNGPPPYMKQPFQTRCFKEALARVEHLFVDTPGVQLTPADAAQMAGLDRQVCRVVLQTLSESGVLKQRMRGVFVRRSSDSY